MQKQPFPVGGGGSKKFEDWGRGLKNFKTGGGYHYMPWTSDFYEKNADLQSCKITLSEFCYKFSVLSF